MKALFRTPTGLNSKSKPSKDSTMSTTSKHDWISVGKNSSKLLSFSAF